MAVRVIKTLCSAKVIPEAANVANQALGADNGFLVRSAAVR